MHPKQYSWAISFQCNGCADRITSCKHQWSKHHGNRPNHKSCFYLLIRPTHYGCSRQGCHPKARIPRRRRWVGAKIPRCSFTGTSTQLGVQMTNDVQLTKASSSTTSIVKGSFFSLLTMALWFEEPYRNWLMISELATNFTIWWFPPFKNKNRLFALFLSRCYWTWMVDIIFAYCI